MGRRWGKTIMAGSLALAEAHGVPGYAGAAVAWVVPTYRNARALWRFVEQHVGALPYASLLRAEMTVQFRHSGGHVTVYTADNDVSIRGESFDLAIFDEAARMREETYTDVILPTLADREGRCLLISTPQGRNWFWREFQRGLADGKYQASFTAPSSANPNPRIQRAAQLARERVSERSYRQEWLAEFVSDEGGVFRGVTECSVLSPTPPGDDAQYVIGVDWGRANDETVCSVWDVAKHNEVYLDRYTGIPFALQYRRIAALAQRYHDALVIAEANSAQDAHIEALAALNVRVMPWITTQASKAYAVDRLAAALERSAVRLQRDPEGVTQMIAYESSRTNTGLVRYAAPIGMHDDIVMARLIAYSELGQETVFPLEQEYESI